MKNEYYIYGAYGKNGELLYIGYGKGSRYKHCNTGISSSKALNRYYFLNGENKCIKVEKLFENLLLEDATHLELLCIQYLNPSCNVAGVCECSYLSATDVVKYENLIQYYLNKEIPDWAVEHHLKVTKKLIKDGDKIMVNPKFIQHGQ